ncbi:MAG: type VI secretion system protein TssA [Burkholderiales bacterium]|nr:type VI secretion system protein TssA [Burkholderiales bacterium]
MPATDLFDPETLLAPLDDSAPCGPDLEYDPVFQALEQAGAGTPERQYGDKVFPAEPPDWQAVREHALALAGRTRDLRVAVWLLRCGARGQGLAGALPGLRLVRGLLERHWDHLHPQLDASDDNDPTMRLNALLPLYAADGALADLRAAAVAPVRGGLTLRELELGLGRDAPRDGEVLPTEAGVLEGLQALIEKHPAVADTLSAAAATAKSITDTVQSAVGMRAPDGGPLVRLLKAGGDAVAKLQGSGADNEGSESAGGDAEGGASESGGARAGRGAAGGALRTRADAARELERIAVWIEQNEPSNPAPLLIRRAQRLMNMSFIEIIRDMASAGLDQVETIAGPREES